MNSDESFAENNMTTLARADARGCLWLSARAEMSRDESVVT